ncbi:MAG: alpha/beta hydrolase family protein, partial [Myxococcales bacterium]
MPSPRPLLLALCAAHAAACAPSVNLRPGAQPPRYAAGLRELTLEDGARVRRLNAALWYPAPPASDVRAFRPMPIFQPLAVARDAPPAPGAPRPLVVVSAGGYGTRYSQGWLAAALAEDGYLVLTLDHPGSRRGELTSAGLHRQGDRARDVSFALTHLLGHAEWGPRIAPERIGFAGHSFGGITGVLLAGGRYDAAAQRAACADSADRFCELLRQLDPGPVQDDPDTASLRDERFLAHFLMATSPAEGVVPP